MKVHVTSFPTFSVAVAGGQWVGKRGNQEDCYGVLPAEDSGSATCVLALLADGVGGSHDGELASRCLVDSFSCAFSGEFASLGASSRRLTESLLAANQHLMELKTSGQVHASAGATFIALSVQPEGIAALSVGDSLLYRQRGKRITKENQAHTWGWELQRRLEAGTMTAAEVAADTQPRHALYGVVCGEPDGIPCADAMEGVPCEIGDRYILASDGLAPLIERGWESMLNAPEWRKASPAKLRDALLAELRKIDAPHQDNATVVVVDILPHPQAAQQCASVSLLGDRPTQQDSEAGWQSSRASLYVVADGAGGHAGGEFASRKVVEFLHSAWRQTLSAGVPPDQARETISAALLSAHDYLIKRAGGKASLSGKSTAVVVYLCDNTYTVVNVGDSRAYMVQDGEWKQLTVDDSLLRIYLQRGEITPEEAVNHPDKNTLTQAIGSSHYPKPHIASGSYTGADSFLLCCDGFWGQLPAEMWKMSCWAASSVRASSHCLQLLAQSAVDAVPGHSDNVSAIWVNPQLPAAAAPVKSRCTPLWMIAPPVLVIILLTILFYLCFYSPMQQEKEAALQAKSAVEQSLRQETAQRQAAEEATRQETAQRRAAEETTRRETEQRQAAEERAQRAESELQVAQDNLRIAEEQRQAAEAAAAAQRQAVGVPDQQQAPSPGNAKKPKGKPAKDASDKQSPPTPAANNPSQPTEQQPPAQSAEPQEPVQAPGADSAQQEAQQKLSTMGVAPAQYDEAIINCVKNNNTAQLILLLAAGADVNAVDEGGCTPLFHGVDKGCMVDLLLTSPDIDVNKANDMGTTPLMWAVCKERVGVVRLLLSARGIDVNKADGSGNPPLYAAVVKGNPEVVKHLLSAPGIEVNKADGSGLTPLKQAQERGHTDIAELIRAAGGHE